MYVTLNLILRIQTGFCDYIPGLEPRSSIQAIVGSALTIFKTTLTGMDM